VAKPNLDYVGVHDYLLVSSSPQYMPPIVRTLDSRLKEKEFTRV